VTRWRLYHPVFKATLNERRGLLEEGIEDQLRELQAATIEVLLDAVRNPGPKQTSVAVSVFRGVVAPRVARGQLLGDTNPDVIVRHEAEKLARERATSIAFGVTDAAREAVLQDLIGKASEPPSEDPTP